ncbi:MAG: acyl-CoA thioesterase [Chitinophagaceae bacterium]|nr:acyl-CoA thioesterase [Chitinophagaceae bacterium]
MKLISRKICMARDIGVHNNLFGGTLMEWIDEAAAAYATEYCYTPNMVTLRVGELLFKKPVKTGNHIRIYGEVVSLGNTSITLKIEVRKYNLYSGEEAVVCTTNMTFVRIDDDGSPTPIGASVRRSHKELMATLEN